ncbi:TonB-dependent receptor [Gimibacter soli]|uniref:TonB-dependent receptor n=1 Tax=Gimibacter soli TaxID=3024400 RepID=A0AAE9XR67_9PROT|nr:TonB-dependent receptor [Gimibacter soli]WCL53395.1 TonB-dependent receptor [Gimibacter soli]
MNKRTGKFLTSLSALALLQTGAANAAADGVDLTFEEIVVTAQKREQRLMEVPMAITAFGGTELEQRGIDSIQDLSFAVPGLTMREDGPGSYQIFLRGIANAYGGGSLVSVYQDEVPMNLTGYDVLPTRTLDLARIEVLKGPQGTLYGQGAVAGTVRYITNDPKLDEFEGSMDATLTSVKSGDMGAEVTGVFNIPVVKDKLAVRIAATGKTGGGWQDQPEVGIEDGNDEELTNLRVKVLWQPTENLSLLGTFISYHAEYELGQGYEQPDRTVFVALDPAKTLIPKVWDYELYNLTMTYDFGGAELMSSTSYVSQDHQYPFAYRGGEETVYGGNYAGNDLRYNPGNQFTQELRLSSTGDGPFQWTLGGFYRDMERSLTAYFEYDYFGFIVEDQEYFSENTSKSHALFANASYKLTDRFEVGAGIRYFKDKASETNGFAPDSVTEKGSFDTVNPRFYLSYAISDDANLYASVGKGFRSGGFNTGGNPPFNPESLWSYEVGLKGSLADGAVYYDLAAYYTEYNDMLRRGLVFLGPELGLQQLVSNVGAAEVKGLEASINWKVTDALTFSAAGTVIDAEVTEITAEDTANVVGDPIDYVPDFSFTLGANYDFNWNADTPGFFRVDYSYRDKLPYVDLTSFPAENTPQYSDKIALLDARVGATLGQFDIEVFVQNLTNENKYIDPYHDWNNANRTRPRTIGVSVGLDF